MSATILLADDEHLLRRMLTRVLQRRNFVVDAVPDGRSALALARRASYDLLLLDVRMPLLGGIEVLRRLRQDAATQRLSVILMSGLGDVEIDVAGLGFAADDYVAKPFDLDELFGRIDRLLARAVPRRGAPPAVLPRRCCPARSK